METITYREAAKLLNCPLGTINNAVYRKVLTKAPSNSVEQRLIKDQVLLFKGKQFRSSMLSEGELKLWNEYRDLVESPTSLQSSLLERGVPKGGPFPRVNPLKKWLKTYKMHLNKSTQGHMVYS